ncbi:MAG TPA: hypothetical protein VKJ47_17135 [Candidatus Binatia bacterium]|nr:hypothetical protein [Candidatus Binatia bacterium]
MRHPYRMKSSSNPPRAASASIVGGMSICGEVHAVPINPPLAGHSSGAMEGKRCCAARAVIAAALAMNCA